MNTYTCYTLIDITNTGVTNHSIDNNLGRNQQRNWETIMQLLTLRTTIFDVVYQGVEMRDLSEYSFGVNYSGDHRVWEFTFQADNDYFKNNDRYGVIKNDIQKTPAITNLTETVVFPEKFFISSGPNMNIYLKSSIDS